MNIMELKEISKDIYDVDEWLDRECGKVGTPERAEFRREAYMYSIGQLINEARKREKMTQSQLAEKVGTNKSYISRIEKGLIEPGVALFFRIIEALGLKIEIVRPLMWQP